MEANNISFEDRRDVLEAKRILEPFNIPFIDAVRTFAKLSDELAEYNVKLPQAVENYKEWHKTKQMSVSLRRAIETYTASKENSDLSKLYTNKIVCYLERFCEDFGDKRIVAHISHTEIEAWMNNIKTKVYVDSPTETLNGKPRRIFIETDTPIAAVSRKGYRTTLFSFFKFCKMRDWVKENPIEKIALVRQKLKTPKFFKVAEVVNMLVKSEQQSDIRAYLAIGAFAGLRRREIERLTWDKIKLSDREIVMDNEVTKTGSRRIVKITENLAEWLTPYAKKLKTHEHIIERNFQKRFDDFRKANKIKWTDNGLRHSAATYYLALTKNAYLTAEQMGHSVDVLKQHYNGLAREKEAIAYFAIVPTDAL